MRGQSRRRFLRAVGGSVGAGGLARETDVEVASLAWEADAAPSGPAGDANAGAAETGAVDGTHPTLAVDAANTGHNPDATVPAADPVERWAVEMGASVGSPVVDGETVYASATDGTLVAVDAATGCERRWTVDTGSEYFAAPAVAGGTVYATSTTGTVYAVDAADGSVAWTFEAGEFYSSPTVVDETVYVGSVDTNVYALDAADGTEQWRFRTDSRVGRVEMAPAVVDGTVYVGCDSNVAYVYALDAADGTEQWRFEMPENASVVASPAVVDGTVYAAGESHAVSALDAADGTERWRYVFDESEPVGAGGSPAVADDVVYVPDVAGEVHALAADDGAVLWRTDLGDSVFDASVVADGLLCVPCRDGAVYALDAGDGSERWRFETGSGVQAPAAVDGTLYVGSGDGHLYAVAEDGSFDPTDCDAGTAGPSPGGTPTATRAAGRSTDTQSATDAPSDDDGLLWLAGLFGAGALALGTVTAAWYRRRTSDGVLHLRNVSSSPLSCRVGCRTADGERFRREYRLGAGEATDVGGLPPNEEFELAVAVTDGPTVNRTVGNTREGAPALVCRATGDEVTFEPAED